MSLVRKKQTITPVPAGTHLAVCSAVIDLGVQETAYGPKEQLWINWELPGQTKTWYDKATGKEHNGRMTISAIYAQSTHPKSKLEKHLRGWFGRNVPMDTASVLGKACMLSVEHTESLEGVVRANVAAINAAPEGAAPKITSKLLVYDVDNDPDPEVFALLPSYIQDMIRARVKDSPAVSVPAPAPTTKLEEDFDDEIPF